MLASHRRALVAAVTTFLWYGALALLFSKEIGHFTKYPQAARHYLTGALPAERLLDFSPFYLYLHVVQGALLPDAWWIIVGLQVLAAGLAASLLLLLLESFFPPWIAAIGTAAFVLSRSPTVYAAVLEPEAFLLLFLIAFLYFTQRAEPGSRWMAGLSLALALAIRPNVLPLLAVVPVYSWLNQGTSKWLRSTGQVLVPSLLILGALFVRNTVQTGSHSPLGMNPGFVFFEGNNPLSSGRSSVYPPVVAELKYDLVDQPDNPHVAYRMIASRASGRALSTADANRYWRGKALHYIADHPGRFFATLATKAYSALHGYRAHDVGPAQHYDVRLGERWIPLFPFALLSALALCGLPAQRRWWRRALLLHALLASQLLLMLVMYVSERQRLATLPGLVFLACSALASFAAASRARRALLGAVSCALTAVFMLPNHRAREDRHLWAVYQTSDRAWADAVRLRDERRLQEAARSAASSFAAAPWLEDYSRPSGLGFAPEGFAGRALQLLGPEDADPSRAFDRAQLLIAARRPTEAESLSRRLLENGDRFDRGSLHSSEPRYYLAQAMLQQGRRPEAVGLLEEARADRPGDPFILALLFALTENAEYRDRIVRYFSEIDAHFLIGLAALQNDGDARADLAETVRLVPELWRARIYEVAALGAAGDLDAATRLYVEATRGKQDPSLLEERIVRIFSATADSSPTDASARYQYGLVLAQFGRFEEALAAFHAAQSIEPRAEVESAITEVERMKAFSGGSH